MGMMKEERYLVDKRIEYLRTQRDIDEFKLNIAFGHSHQSVIFILTFTITIVIAVSQFSINGNSQEGFIIILIMLFGILGFISFIVIFIMDKKELDILFNNHNNTVNLLKREYEKLGVGVF